MAKKFSDLRAQMKPEALVRADAVAKTMLAEMPLNELRQARGLSQKMLAEVLHVQQPSIAKIEKRTDMYPQPCAATSRPWVGNWISSPAFRTAR